MLRIGIILLCVGLILLALALLVRILRDAAHGTCTGCCASCGRSCKGAQQSPPKE